MIQLILAWAAKNWKTIAIIIVTIFLTTLFMRGCNSPNKTIATTHNTITDTTYITKDSTVYHYHDSTFFVPIPFTMVDTSRGISINPTLSCSPWKWQDVITRPDSGWVKIEGLVTCNPPEITNLSLQFSPIQEHIVYVDSSSNNSSDFTLKTTVTNNTVVTNKQPFLIFTPYLQGDVYSSVGGISAAVGIDLSFPDLLKNGFIPYLGGEEKISGAQFGQAIHVGILRNFNF